MKNVINSVENNVIKFWVEDDLLYVVYKKGCIISLDTAKEIVALRLKFQNGKSYKGIVHVPQIGTITPDARKYLSKNGYEGIEKLALVATSKISTLLGNLFVTINKPPKPTHVFSNQEDALKWLKSDR